MSGAEGTTKIIGNNPMGFAAPSAYMAGEAGEGFPLLFDIAMSYASWGKINERIGAGEAIPALWARDGEGRPTTDPAKARDGGTVTPMAEHKGFGLAVMNELLTAGLAGGEMAGELVDSGGVNTHSQTALAIDVGRIIPLETFLDLSLIHI